MWASACLRGWSSEIETPDDWRAVCDGQADAATTAELSTQLLQGFEPFIPGIVESRVQRVDAGVIFCWGKTDIDDRDSELHRRYDIGVHSHDGYFSIDTGKYTCAPMFAAELVHRLT